MPSLEQLQLIGQFIAGAEAIGAEIIGGIRAVVRLFTPDISDEDLNAAEDVIAIDAARRRSERARMAGDPPPAPAPVDQSDGGGNAE